MSQPAPGDFAIVYDRLRHEYEHIISVHISSALSGTCNAAMIARDMFPQVDISVVDTKAASLGLAWTLLLCARAIAGGKKPAEVVALAQAVSRQQQILFTVDSLEWLQKTGRIGKASALLGSLLNWHPVLQIDDGYVAPYDRVRGSMDKVLVRMTDAMTELVGSQGPVYDGIAHAQRQELAQQLAQLLQSTYTIREQMIYSFGPIIGVNTGPGAVGCVLVPASALD